MSKHSPTPWTVNYGSDIHDKNGDLVAAVHGTEESEEAANVALIAAAPGMLAALRAVIHAYEHGGIIDPINQALAAIALAGGRSNG